MEKVAGQLKTNKEQVYQQIHQLKQSIDQLIHEIANTHMTATQIDNAYNDLVASIDREFRRLKQVVAEQKMKDEQDELKRIQSKLENEKHAIFDEDKRFEQEKEEFRQRSAIAQRQKEEEQLMGKVNAEESHRRKELREQELAEEAFLSEMNERERRDYDLARRIASETGSEVDLPHLQRKTRLNINQKHDLRGHNYAQLRDLINTSCDLELLDACREEFHRRLKVYHAWKLKNRKGKNSSAADDKDDELDEDRAPKAILNNAMPVSSASSASKKGGQGATAASNSKGGGSGKASEQRFFRIPFLRPNEQSSDASDQKKKGWWYAHFDDKWIARQMEIHPNKKPILLVSGIDDMNMCELSLDETGLTVKKGAEILENDFEQEWLKNGGREYLKKHHKKISSKYVLQSLEKHR
ncbi:unnamed protein product [Rotaria magnacalcarata]|nr:unnamed protein product [Rotaria magnacalcarata]